MPRKEENGAVGAVAVCVGAGTALIDAIEGHAGHAVDAADLVVRVLLALRQGLELLHGEQEEGVLSGVAAGQLTNLIACANGARCTGGQQSRGRADQQDQWVEERE